MPGPTKLSIGFTALAATLLAGGIATAQVTTATPPSTTPVKSAAKGAAGSLEHFKMVGEGLKGGSAFPAYEVPNLPEAAEAYYAPDSVHLIAQTRDPAALKTPFGTAGALTYIFADDGSDVWRVNDHGQDGCSFFFPNGKRVVWTSTRDNLNLPVGNWSAPEDYPQGADLYASDLDGKNIKRLTNTPYYEAEVSVSPDGKWIVFGRQIDGNMDLWVMKSDGTEERQVTHTLDWQEGAPFFMQDNEHIIFRAWRRTEIGKIKPTPMTVMTIKKDGSDWRRHTYDSGMNWHPFPAPDGHHYTFVKAVSATDWQAFIGDLAGGEPKQLTFGGNFNGMAHMSPNGEKMVFSRGTGKGFMQGIRTFVMAMRSMNLGPKNYVKWNPSWGQPMQPDPGDPKAN